MDDHKEPATSVLDYEITDGYRWFLPQSWDIAIVARGRSNDPGLDPRSGTVISDAERICESPDRRGLSRRSLPRRRHGRFTCRAHFSTHESRPACNF